MKFNWCSAGKKIPKKFKCGYCDNDISSESGYVANTNDRNISRNIFICHTCEKPNFFDQNNHQTPGPAHGNSVKHVPEGINKLYNESRDCMKVGASTASVLLCRKLLMHIGVEKGAKEGLSFLEYVNFLSDKNYVPPDGKGWVDDIRKKGNEVNHKIVLTTVEDAKDLIDFLDMLLKIIYEFPQRHANKTKNNSQ